MAIDLSDLVESLQREVNAPGISQLPDATDADYLGNLQDGFWEAVLDGIISGYTETDGIVTPTSGSTDLSRQLQQLVVFYAGFRIVRNQLRDIKTLFRARSGETEYEVQQAASILKSIMDDLRERRNILLGTLSSNGVVNSVYVDALTARDDSYIYSDIYWVND